MSNFDHVDDANTRAVLAGDLSEDAICQALTWANQCCQADQHNEDVSFEMQAARAEALENAEYEWNEEGDAFECVEHLKQFWSV